MSLITYFKETLPCAHCDHVGTAWIASKLGSRGATYQVGDCPADDIPAVDFGDTSFVVREPADGEPVRVLTSWTCEACGLGSFAELVLADGCVRAIEPSALTADALARVHYIAETMQEDLESVVGEPIDDEPAHWLPRLRQALEPGA